MDNKLQELTNKLYDEGLEKGRADAERMVAEAEQKAAQIVADAQAQAEQIIKQAKAKAADTQKNTMTEITLAGKQALAAIKAEIADLIVAKSTAEGVHAAGLDADFIRETLLAAAKNWSPSASAVELKALLPESARTQLDARLKASVDKLLAAGVEVGYSSDVKTGFKVGEKKGGYYISFSDESFEALLGEYLRDKVFRILYDKQ